MCTGRASSAASTGPSPLEFHIRILPSDRHGNPCSSPPITRLFFCFRIPFPPAFTPQPALRRLKQYYHLNYVLLSYKIRIWTCESTSKEMSRTEPGDGDDDEAEMQRRYSIISNTQYVAVGDNAWTLVNRQEDSIRHNVVGFGCASIPSYECLVKRMPDRTMTFNCITFNINEKPASVLKAITNYLVRNEQKGELEDVIAIAIQEIPPSSRAFHIYSLGMLETSISESHSIYISHRVLSQMIMIFLRKDHLRYAISNPTVKFIPSAAVAKPMRTKGSVGVCFRLYQRMIVLVASHFSHSNVQTRVQNYHKMVQALRFPTLKSFNGGDDLMFSADAVIWFGDLNFRMVAPIKDGKPCMDDDELTIGIKQGLLFKGFHEARICFSPTHKFESGKGIYVHGRIPSYTDRVLFWSQLEGLVVPIEYGSINEVTQSDHRPVYCALRMIMINKPIPAKYFRSTEIQE